MQTETKQMKVTINRRWYSTLPAIEVEIDAEFEGKTTAVRLGAAVKVAFKSGADLSGADLSGAVLRGADLSEAVLSGAVLREAVLSGAVLSGAVKFDDIPAIPDLESKILAAVDGGAGKLQMKSWHICETTHCRAGWAVHIAGEVGYALEKAVGPATAGALIYARATPDAPIPDFYCDNATALADLRKRAQAQG